ncbi:MAG: hypothetical protein R6V06_06825 [Kiritimatiellia bacterium]
MKKAITLTAMIFTAMLFSGCYCVGTHKAQVDGGKKTTTGLFSFDAIDNGYPMIPFYSKFEESE